jgi:hypothetical protein
MFQGVHERENRHLETNMIQVTSKAAAYIAEHGGNLTLYSKTLSG